MYSIDWLLHGPPEDKAADPGKGTAFFNFIQYPSVTDELDSYLQILFFSASRGLGKDDFGLSKQKTTLYRRDACDKTRLSRSPPMVLAATDVAQCL